MTCHPDPFEKLAIVHRTGRSLSGVASRPKPIAWIALTSFVTCILAPSLSRAGDLDLLSVGIRARIGEKRLLGEVAPESFKEYDAVASVALPWDWYSRSGWGIGTKLLGSAGALQGAGKTALVTSLIPVLALGSQDGRFSFEAGAGAALISEHRFGRQDFGGPYQFALTFGLRVPLYKRLGAGYRFMHYSDANVYGSYTTGADFHMVELTYLF